MRATLAQFLDDNPGFVFDLEQHLHATAQADALRRRREAFLSWLSEPLEADAERRSARISALTEPPVRFVDKEAIRRHPERFRSAGLDQTQLWGEYTSGTSGSPVLVPYTADAFFDMLLQTVFRITALNGLAALLERPVQSLTVSDGQMRRNQVWVHPEARWGFAVLVVIDETSPASFDSLFDRIEALAPGCLTAMPRHLQGILHHASTARPFPSGAVEVVIASGATLDPGFRGELERALGCPVINAYGLTELGIVACECPVREGLHVFGDCIDIWCLSNVKTSPLRWQEGELVMSSAANPALVLRNLRTGDLGRLTEWACPCGRPGARITKLAGRIIDNFRAPGGGLVSPKRFFQIIDQDHVEEFQVRQTAPESFVVSVQVSAACSDRAVVLEAVRNFVREALPFEASVTVTEARLRGMRRFRRYIPFEPPGS